MSDEDPLVLVVEDEPDLADLYAAWLGDENRVHTAYGGREALEALDPGIDVVLLDRRMPSLSGDEVLASVRDRGIDARVAMVTAVEPDFDIVEMGFDDYLVKPVTKDALHETVTELLRRSEYDTGVQEFYALASKKGLLESEKSQSTLDDSEEYRELTERMEELRGRLDEALTAFDDHEEFESLFRGLGDDDGEFDPAIDDGGFDPEG